MSRYVTSALLSLVAFTLLAVPSSARELRTNPQRNLPEGWDSDLIGHVRSYTPNLAALKGGEVPFRYAMLNDAKRDYTLVVIDDILLRKQNSPRQPDDGLQAISPSLAVTSDNHRGRLASENRSASAANTIPTSLDRASLSTCVHVDTPSHTREYLETRK
ncbi:MAG: hypothetical protein M1395_10280 [Bacteroidetes bacterium]|jgi:hypothetical protein|nr:hypothetical protein [Bacteroidota bacterium]